MCNLPQSPVGQGHTSAGMSGRRTVPPKVLEFETPQKLSYVDTFVPAVIRRQLPFEMDANSQSVCKSMTAVALFADVSGFTTLTEKLAREDRGSSAAAESVTSLVNTIFDLIIRVTTAAGGDVLTFAGDAITVLFPITEESQGYLPKATASKVAAKALMCGFSILDHIAQLEEGRNLSVKLCFSTAPCDILMTPGAGMSWKWLMIGPLSELVNICQDSASPNAIVATQETRDLVLDGDCPFEFSATAEKTSAATREDWEEIVTSHSSEACRRQRLLKVLAKEQDILSDSSDGAGREKEMLDITALGFCAECPRPLVFAVTTTVQRRTPTPPQVRKLIVDECDPLRSPLVRGRICVTPVVNNRACSRRPVEGTIVKQERYMRLLLNQIRMFVPAHVREADNARYYRHHGTTGPIIEQQQQIDSQDFVSQIRLITCCFVRFDVSTKNTNSLTLHMVRDVAKRVDETVSRSGGVLNKLLNDEKGFIALIVFGLPTFTFMRTTHGTYGQTAIETATDISMSLNEIDVACSFGICSGRALCGIVGNSKRMEYTVMGEVVNRSCRLMSEAGWSEIVCDGETLGNAIIRVGWDKESIQLKGYESPVECFRIDIFSQLVNSDQSPLMCGDGETEYSPSYSLSTSSGERKGSMSMSTGSEPHLGRRPSFDAASVLVSDEIMEGKEVDPRQVQAATLFKSSLKKVVSHLTRPCSSIVVKGPSGIGKTFFTSQVASILKHHRDRDGCASNKSVILSLDLGPGDIYPQGRLWGTVINSLIDAITLSGEEKRGNDGVEMRYLDKDEYEDNDDDEDEGDVFGVTCMSDSDGDDVDDDEYKAASNGSSAKCASEPLTSRYLPVPERKALLNSNPTTPSKALLKRMSIPDLSMVVPIKTQHTRSELIAECLAEAKACMPCMTATSVKLLPSGVVFLRPKKSENGAGDGDEEEQGKERQAELTFFLVKQLLMRMGRSRGKNKLTLIISNAQNMDNTSMDILRLCTKARLQMGVYLMLQNVPRSVYFSEWLHTNVNANYVNLKHASVKRLLEIVTEQIPGADDLHPELARHILRKCSNNTSYVKQYTKSLIQAGQVEVVKQETLSPTSDFDFTSDATQGSDDASGGEKSEVQSISSRCVARLKPKTCDEPLPVSVPGEIEVAFTKLLDGLPQNVQLTLKVASVVGTVFRLEEIVRVHPEAASFDAVCSHIDLAAEAGLVKPRFPLVSNQDKYKVPWKFCAELCRDYIYSTLLTSQKAKLHMALALFRVKQRQTSSTSHSVDRAPQVQLSEPPNVAPRMKRVSTVCVTKFGLSPEPSPLVFNDSLPPKTPETEDTPVDCPSSPKVAFRSRLLATFQSGNSSPRTLLASLADGDEDSDSLPLKTPETEDTPVDCPSSPKAAFRSRLATFQSGNSSPRTLLASLADGDEDSDSTTVSPIPNLSQLRLGRSTTESEGLMRARSAPSTSGCAQSPPTPISLGGVLTEDSDGSRSTPRSPRTPISPNLFTIGEDEDEDEDEDIPSPPPAPLRVLSPMAKTPKHRRADFNKINSLLAALGDTSDSDVEGTPRVRPTRAVASPSSAEGRLSASIIMCSPPPAMMKSSSMCVPNTSVNIVEQFAIPNDVDPSSAKCPNSPPIQFRKR